MTATSLPQAQRILVVVAHPDDETFGLGALLCEFVDAGTEVSVVCFTHGEASTLGLGSGELATIREKEFHDAGVVLGVEQAIILDYPDGALGEAPVRELVAQIGRNANSPDLVIAFDQGGITGHPDHVRATEAAVMWGIENGVSVLAWALSEVVAKQLTDEFSVRFFGREDSAIEIKLTVDRTRQLQAIDCHKSQAVNNAVLQRRLELQANQETLVYLSSCSAS